MASNKMYIYTVLTDVFMTIFSPTKNGIKSVVSVFRCNVSVGNISFFPNIIFLLLIAKNQVRFLSALNLVFHHHEETEQNDT